MTASFDSFKPLLVPLEGNKLTDIADDAGGLTRYGISKVMHPEVDVANITLEDAYKWYEHNYWNQYQLSRIDSQEIANKLMSFLINENPTTAIRCLQRAVSRCGGFVTEDGILGPNTIYFLNLANPMWLLDRLRIEGALFYLTKVKSNPNQIKFLAGWCNRALE